jgi:hypothetical protein
MDEAEWLSGTRYWPMMEFLRGKVSERKLRLLACALVRSMPFRRDGRSIWDLLPKFEWFRISDQQGRPLDCRGLIEIAERHADGLASDSEWQAARELGREIRRRSEADCFENDPVLGPGANLRGSWFRQAAAVAVEHVTEEDRDSLCLSMFDAFSTESFHRTQMWDRTSKRLGHPDPGLHACMLIEDSFGNPFRDVAFDPDWLTRCDGAVARIAGSIYEGRDFDRMPMLGEALEGAGCADPDILAHCRGYGGYRRGRWHVRGCWVLDALLGKP